MAGPADPRAGAAGRADHDLETIVAIRHVIERHGSGPYPPEDLAALTGVDVAGVQRALDEMVRAGLAAKGDTPPADEA